MYIYNTHTHTQRGADPVKLKGVGGAEMGQLHTRGLVVEVERWRLRSGPHPCQYPDVAPQVLDLRVGVGWCVGVWVGFYPSIYPSIYLHPYTTPLPSPSTTSHTWLCRARRAPSATSSFPSSSATSCRSLSSCSLLAAAVSSAASTRHCSAAFRRSTYIQIYIHIIYIYIYIYTHIYIYI